MRNWNCGCSMFDKLLVRNSPYSPYSNFFHIPCQTGLKTRNRGMRTLRGMRYYAMTALKSLLTRAENVKSVVSPDCLWYMMMHRYALPPGSISMVDETIVICVGLVEYVPRKVCGIRFWYDVRNFSLHGETTILETLPSSCVLARIFSFFFLMGCRPRLKNHEQFVTNQQAPSRNHSEGEKFNKIMHHQTCIQHTYIDKIRGCCKRNM